MSNTQRHQPMMHKAQPQLGWYLDDQSNNGDKQFGKEVLMLEWWAAFAS